MKNLIKRKNLNYNIKDGWYCEVKKNMRPSGCNALEGETIYIAQNGYAIFAKGIISEKKIIEIDNFSDFVKYCLNESMIIDNDYWISKIKEYSKQTKNFKVYILEYKIINTKLFENTIPLEKRFLKQSAWYRIEDDYEFIVPISNSKLTKHIPTKVREEIYHKYKININEHPVDIDHFVPLSIGGPGNIIENLIPVGPSINRRKGDKIPSKLFDLSKKFGVDIPSQISIRHDKFYQSTQYKKLAKKIISSLNNQSIENIRKDYKAIRDYHFPSLKSIA